MLCLNALKQYLSQRGGTGRNREKGNCSKDILDGKPYFQWGGEKETTLSLNYNLIILSRLAILKVLEIHLSLHTSDGFQVHTDMPDFYMGDIDSNSNAFTCRSSTLSYILLKYSQNAILKYPDKKNE